MEKSTIDNYGDIIDLPHPNPQQHPRMSRRQRAVKFSPFAAIEDGHRNVK